MASLLLPDPLHPCPGGAGTLSPAKPASSLCDTCCSSAHTAPSPGRTASSSLLSRLQSCVTSRAAFGYSTWHRSPIVLFPFFIYTAKFFFTVHLTASLRPSSTCGLCSWPIAVSRGQSFVSLPSAHSQNRPGSELALRYLSTEGIAWSPPRPPELHPRSHLLLLARLVVWAVTGWFHLCLRGPTSCFGFVVTYDPTGLES